MTINLTKTKLTDKQQQMIEKTVQRIIGIIQYIVMNPMCYLESSQCPPETKLFTANHYKLMREALQIAIDELDESIADIDFSEDFKYER
jgi:hypothetical protein